MHINQLLILFIIIPGVSFISTLFWKNKNERPIGAIVRFAKVANMLLSLFFATWWALNGFNPISYHSATIYETERFVFAIELYYDEITAVFSIVGSFLFFLVSTFSKYYMHRDEGYKRFFYTILLFAVGYNFIILAGNFETLFIGWEIKGVCSFILIAFYRNRYLPVKNAFKAISYYRISDISLMLAMWMMHHLTHQNIVFTKLAEAKVIAQDFEQNGMGFFIVILLIIPAMIKSAQLPFTAWLPRAMEGPTASSAIFYGSLSVHIGVFLLLRTHPFWEEMVWAKVAIIVVGATTAIITSLIASVQPTVKTQIAYSSAAQIGLMFIEVAIGWHWLVLIHFAGNAFLRTYQLLVSPSVLNYLIHQQIFKYTPPLPKRVSSFVASLYILNLKEWNLDRFMFRFFWSPFKWIGTHLIVLNNKFILYAISIVGLLFIILGLMQSQEFAMWYNYLSYLSIFIALAVLLFAFAYRASAIRAWFCIINAHLFIVAAVIFNAEKILPIEMVFYFFGIAPAFLIGHFCLKKIKAIDNDISLNQYHGYVFEQEITALFFLFSVLAILGFPITSAFISIDVFFTYIDYSNFAFIIMMALCYYFIEISAFRILLRVFMGPHKKLYHPVALRST